MVKISYLEIDNFKIEEITACLYYKYRYVAIQVKQSTCQVFPKS